MILVKKTADSTSQKVVATFLKRVKKYNSIARKRKTRYWVKPPTKRQQKIKAVRKAQYLEKQAQSSYMR